MTQHIKTKQDNSSMVVRKQKAIDRKSYECGVIEKLQSRLIGCLKIIKSNKDDEQVQQYQAGRKTELEYCIYLMLTPYQRLKLSKSLNRTKYILSKKIAALEERTKHRLKPSTLIPIN